VPAPIVAGVIDFLNSQALGVNLWDGEVPRYDTTGQPVVDTMPEPQWPAVKVYMREPGFHRDWTTEDPYYDYGQILIQAWTTSRQALEGDTKTYPQLGLLNRIEAILAQASNWQQIAMGGSPTNPYYVVLMQLLDWYSGQEEGVRTFDSQLLYRGDLIYEVGIHGAMSTY